MICFGKRWRKVLPKGIQQSHVIYCCAMGCMAVRFDGLRKLSEGCLEPVCVNIGAGLREV